MPRNGSGQFVLPSGSTAEPNTTIESAKYNAALGDIVTDLNTPRPISVGGTGASTEQGARDALKVAQAQTSVTDSTAGRGLILGAFGIGGRGAPAGGDLNAVVLGGLYIVEADTINTPGGTGPAGATCLVSRYSSTDVQQLALVRGASPADVKAYVRQMRAGAWGAWSQVVTVLDAGSNANGEYTTFSDGRQECTATVSLNLAAAAGYVTFNFPKAFSNVRGVSWGLSGTTAAGTNIGALGAVFVAALSTTQWQVRNPGGGASAVNIKLTAHGTA